MKLIVFLFVVFSPDTTKNDTAMLYQLVKELIPQTRSIMKELRIPLRKVTDSAVLVVKLEQMLGLAAKTKGTMLEDRNCDTLGIITVAPSTLFYIKSKDSTNAVWGRSVLVHELVHCLQDNAPYKKDYIDYSKRTEPQYVRQKCEFEAFTVDAFYYLQQLYPQRLEELFSKHLSRKRIHGLIIQEVRQHECWGCPVIFK
jgi:hypothetical protein